MASLLSRFLVAMSEDPRILVADDDSSIRHLMGTIVRREGLEVDIAADGDEAIELLKAHEYSVILLDLMMPRIDGFGVIEYLKRNPPSFKPVVLVITAYADQKFKDVDPAIVAGVVRKPFEIADIGAIARMCVDGFGESARKTLLESDDRAIRDFAKHVN